MAYVKIWVHLVWTTKNREPILTQEIRWEIFSHIRENTEKKGIYIDFINRHMENVHCLISLGSGQNIDKIQILLKGESSYWINKNKIFRWKFEWQACLPKGSSARRQDEYFEVSVSESDVNRVRDYIKNQENYHNKNHIMMNIKNM